MEALREALNEAGFAELSEAIDGTLRARLTKLIDYGVIADVLKKHDLELHMRATGPLAFRVVDEVCDNKRHPILCEREVVVTNGPIKRCQFVGVTATGAQLDTLIKTPTVLRVLIGQNTVCVEHILASDIKNGLAHRKRRGLIGPTQKPMPWPKTSRTQRLAAKQVQSTLSWRAYIFGK
jgi:hypothetical protein